MGWLRGRYLAGAIFGAVGGPLAYLSGAKLGAASLPSTDGLVILGITWAAAFPALLTVAEFVRRRLAARAA
jgi:tetrahydromethanopterin S-methyltransferase subunit D